jgi:hypothetical protein
MSRLLRNLLWLLFGLLLGGGITAAQADTVPASTGWYTASHTAQNAATYKIACEYTAAQIGEVVYGGGRTGYVAGVTEGYCSWQRYSSPYCPLNTYCGFNSGVEIFKRLYCPEPGSQLVGDQCTVACPPSGQVHSSGYFDIGTSPTNRIANYACSGSCGMIFSGSSPAAKSVVGGVTHYYAQGIYQYTGAPETCDPSNTPPGATVQVPPDSCGPGQFGGTVNGVFKCYDSSGVEAPTTTPKTTQNSKNETVTDTTNPDGSTTRTTTTTNTDGSTTVTTQNYPAGSPPPVVPTSSTETTTEQQDEEAAFCADNPDSPICKQSDVLTPDVPELYTKDDSGDTFGSVLTAFSNGIKASPAISAASNFFNITVPSGSCAGLDGTLDLMGQPLTINMSQYLCSPDAEAIYTLLAIGVMIGAVWLAFTIAFL